VEGRSREAVALAPHQRVGQRFAGNEQFAALLSEIAQREADIGEESAGQQIDLLLVHQFAGQPDRVLRPPGVVAADHLERPAEHAAGGIDLLDGQLPAVAIRQGERRHRGVGVDLADPDRCCLGGAGDGGGRERCRGRGQKNAAGEGHVSLLR